MSPDRTVHVVDDDAAVRRSLERLLDTAGFRVVSYDSSSAFLEAARGLLGGCVLLDIQMPGVDGLAVQARLNRLGVPLPVIVMTAHGDVARAVQAMKAGAVDFLEKPFDDETLLNGIEAALAKAGRRVGGREPVEAAQRIAPLVHASGKFSMVCWRDARTG
jgi:two-component system, LuxR family, response regulator FixJ